MEILGLKYPFFLSLAKFEKCTFKGSIEFSHLLMVQQEPHTIEVWIWRYIAHWLTMEIERLNQPITLF